MAAISMGLGQLFTIVVMAFALGLDALSLGIGIGMRGIRLLEILKISIIVGVFHVVMPLFGMVMGTYASYLLGDIAVIVGGSLLILLGGHMIINSLRGESIVLFSYSTLWGLLFLALSVSIDSFSVGVSLGLFASNIVLVVLMFGLFGGMMSIIGLWLGRKVSAWLGKYGEAFGGVIIFLFGIKFVV